MEIKVQIKGRVFSICIGRETKWYQSVYWFMITEEFIGERLEVEYAKPIVCLFDNTKRFRLIFRVKPIKYIFYKNWYSTFRFKNPYISNLGDVIRIIDFGMFSFGYAYSDIVRTK